MDESFEINKLRSKLKRADEKIKEVIGQRDKALEWAFEYAGLLSHMRIACAKAQNECVELRGK